MQNPKVYLSISINNQTPKHLTIELYADTTPLTAAKFHSLITGQNISHLHYKNSTFHRILLRENDHDHKVTALCQGGTLPNVTKQEIESVFGIGTKAENFAKKHDGFGTVSMVSPRGTQFFILSGVSERNDGKYVVVGRVVEGLDVVREIAGVGTFTGETLGSVVIVDCGVVREHSVASSISAYQKKSSKGFEKVISTSHKQLLNSLKKIMNVNKLLTEVDPDDVVLENEEDLVGIVGRMEHNLNTLLHLKAELGSLEKRQDQLLSQTRTKDSRPRKEIIPKMTETETTFPAKLAEKSARDSVGFIPSPFITKEMPKKKKIKSSVDANPLKTTPSETASRGVRKCLHCGTASTPLWRCGPLGPKTLCNACGVRYKSGRLLPHYRPAACPTFDPAVHTNSHRKATEMMEESMFEDVIDLDKLSILGDYVVVDGHDLVE